MKKKVEEICKGVKCKLQQAKEKFVKEERGDSHLVSIIVVIVIVVTLGGVFSGQLSGIIDQAFGNVTTFIEDNEP